MRKEARQVYALFVGDGPDSMPRLLPDGDANAPAQFDLEKRTFKQLTRAGLMICPVKGCEPFATTAQGVVFRSHFRHESQREDGLHRSGPESVWHLQAKLSIFEWLSGAVDPTTVVELQLEYEQLPALRDGRRRRPDVYVEFTDGAKIAFECQQQTMAGTDPKDQRAMWQNRVDDYRELRDACGLQVVWLVSPWSTIKIVEHERSNVWRVKAFGGYGAELLERDEIVYWIDPTFGQVGTLVEHVARPRDVPLHSGYIKHAKRFHRRDTWYWLHSDNIVDLRVDPVSGAVWTPTDDIVREHQPIADRHVELLVARREAEDRERAASEAERVRRQALERAARQDRDKRQALEQAAKVAAARKRHQEWVVEVGRQLEAEALRHAKDRQLARDVIATVAVIVVLAMTALVLHHWLVG